MQLNLDNWFYCRICDTPSYDFKCECKATSCNGGGCEKCGPLHKLVDEFIANGLVPEILKTPESMLNPLYN